MHDARENSLISEPSLTDLRAELTRDGALVRLLAEARREDLGGHHAGHHVELGDVTTRSIIEPGRRGAGALVAREPGLVAGLAFVPEVIAAFDVDLAFEVAGLDPTGHEGQAVAAGRVIGTFAGDLAGLLAVERTVLNLIGRLSGIATLTRQYVDAVAGTGVAVCATRKTAPGWRLLEKYAVRCGGGVAHRMGLYDAALYKDNHLAHVPLADLARVLAGAARAARASTPRPLAFVQVEVDSLDQLREVLGIEAGLIDMVLLDNMSVPTLRDAVGLRDATAPGVRLEASGGVTLTTVRGIAATGVDRISIGALTHAASSLDVGLDLEPEST